MLSKLPLGAGFALATMMTAGVASAETTGATDGPDIPPSVEIDVEEGPYTADQTIEVTATGFTGSSADITSLSLLVDGVDSGTSCGEGSATCMFELSLEAGTHELEGQVVVSSGEEAFSEPLTIEVDAAASTGGEQTGGEQTGGEQTGGEQTGGSQTSGSEPEAEDDDSGGCSVGGSGAPVGPLAALFTLGFWARRRR